MSSSSTSQSHVDHQPSETPDETKEKMIKQLKRVVCICKGIPLSQVLPALKDHQEVDPIHESVGTGSGGCKGRRCTPRIETLIEKAQDLHT